MASRDDLPARPDLEKLILGAILGSPDPNATFAKAASILDESCFFLDDARVIFGVMCRLAQRSTVISTGGIFGELRVTRKAIKLETIVRLTKDVPELVSIDPFCKEVLEASEKRRLLETLTRIEDTVYDGHSFSESLQSLQSAVALQPHASKFSTAESRAGPEAA